MRLIRPTRSQDSVARIGEGVVVRRRQLLLGSWVSRRCYYPLYELKRMGDDLLFSITQRLYLKNSTALGGGQLSYITKSKEGLGRTGQEGGDDA